ncbi:ABC1 family-domain-containing protein [Polychytrium aggregatum]|uniref:ABC1 family-domain-containing protein n=1 Tax=Polychytrium aggregatum TaxID=110093 RepID=UPI0022FE8EC5|nr:ABC1 family-domain-containing protein [Polychytrium aggregatum]KAI9202366.1 ABC1 family-domain-containing protein [Polychytrium aggregatum]
MFARAVERACTPSVLQGRMLSGDRWRLPRLPGVLSSLFPTCPAKLHFTGPASQSFKFKQRLLVSASFQRHQDRSDWLFHRLLRRLLPYLLPVGSTASLVWISTHKPSGPGEHLPAATAVSKDLSIDAVGLVHAQPSRQPSKQHNHTLASKAIWLGRIIWRILQLGRLFVPLLAALPYWWISRGRAMFASCDVADTDNPADWWLTWLASTLERAGPLFVKLGQWASTRCDLFPRPVTAALGRLQSGGRPHSIAETRTIISEALGRPMDEIFEEFDPEPIGVGAVAQVHRAVLRKEALDRDDHGNGTQALRECAVKVLHPGVHSRIELDLWMASIAAELIDRIPGLDVLSAPSEMRMFNSMMLDQLDLRVEAQNLARFQNNFGTDRPPQVGEPVLSFPRPVLGLCSRQVLVESFHHGILMKDLLDVGPTVYDSTLANLGVQTFLKMVFRDNFTHADLHAGNIMVSFRPPKISRAGNDLTETGDPPALIKSLFEHDRRMWPSLFEGFKKQGYAIECIILDAGLVCSLSDRNLRNVTDCFVAGMEFDGTKIAELLISRCATPLAEIIDPEGAKERLATLMRQLRLDTDGKLPLSKIHTAEVLNSVSQLIRYHRIKLDGEFVGLFVSCVLVEGIGRSLKGDMDMIDALSQVLD